MRTLITTRSGFAEPTIATIEERFKKCHEEGLWLDIEAPDAEDFEVLAKVFRFHPLAIEDIRHQNQRPKLEEYTDYAFLVLFQSELGTDDQLIFREHHFFLAKDFLVTVHIEPSPLLDALKQRLTANPELARDDPGFLAYLVVDQLVDSLFPVVEQMDRRIDDLEARIIVNAGNSLLGEINQLKHKTIELRRYLSAERDVFQRLISHSLDFHSPELMVYWRDVYDHLVRQYEIVDSLRDLLSNATDVSLSTISNRLSNTMKALTVIASLFLPLTFLTGFYGMNFAYLTQVLETPRAAFAVGIGTMIISIVIQIYYFRRRGWL